MMSTFRPLAIIPLALTVAFGIWELPFAAFMADDLLQLAVLEGVSPSAAWTGPFDLYKISDGNPVHVLAMKDAGMFPWFFDPAFEMGFFRPLSSAMFAFDHALFGLQPIGYRVDSLFWSVLLSAAVIAVFARVLPQRLSMLASLVFVVSAIHGIFVWTAARHIVIAAAFGMLAFLAHLKWRSERWTVGEPLSVLALALSLAASEVGVAVAVYLVAYEMFGVADPVRTRVRASAPVIVVLVAYLLVWRWLGHGASSGAGYLDPLRDPLTFVRELLPRLAVLLGCTIMDGHADLWVIRPDLRSALAAVGALVSIGFALLLRAAWSGRDASERRTLRWAAIATVVSAVPFTGTPIGSRCLLVPLIGGAVLIAAVVERWWTTWRHERFRTLAVAGALVAILHVVLAPFGRLAAPLLLKMMMADRAEAAFRDAELDQRTLTETRVVILTAPDLIVGLHGGAYPLLHDVARPASWHVLSWGPAPHRFTRTAIDTLELQIDGPGIGSSRLHPGMTISMRELEATVLDVGPLGPTRVRIRFNGSLDDPSQALLAWRDGRLRRVLPPAVGAAINLQATP